MALVESSSKRTSGNNTRNLQISCSPKIVVMPNGYEAPLGKGFEYPRNSVRLWVPLGTIKGHMRK